MAHELNGNAIIMMLNGIGVVVAHGLLAASLRLSVDVPMATKGYWGMGIVLLTLSLVIRVKYRFDTRLAECRSYKIDEVKVEAAPAQRMSDANR